MYENALLHAASHVWVWRHSNQSVELLLQKRAANKRTWPSRYDISAAGHIDLGEDELQAATREAEEEIGLKPDISHLEFIGTHRCLVVATDKTWTENEIRFLYLLRIDIETKFKLDDGEVDSLKWKTVSTIKQALRDETLRDEYVPHSDAYFAILFEELECAAKSSS